MRAVLTQVSEATVTVDGETVGAIDCPDTGGLLALVGVSRARIWMIGSLGQRKWRAKLQNCAFLTARSR